MFKKVAVFVDGKRVEIDASEQHVIFPGNRRNENPYLFAAVRYETEVALYEEQEHDDEDALYRREALREHILENLDDDTYDNTDEELFDETLNRVVVEVIDSEDES